MLYVTTRDSQDAYTANRALSENRCPSGGFFVPMRMPHFDEAQISGLGEKSFSQNVADILNVLFGTQLDGWAVEFGIGRYPIKLVPLSGKIIAAEAWHNPAWRFERLACGIEKAIRQSDQIRKSPTDWLLIAARCAVLFGIYGQLLQSGVLSENCKLDVAVPSGDLSALMAAWYARSWGLPIGTIVCSTNENNSLWTLLYKGELRTDLPASKTTTPDCDYTVPCDLERLIFATLGREETARFCDTCRIGGTYSLAPEQAARLREGIHINVVSSDRVSSAILNLYKTTGFIAEPYTALAYVGLIDYRAASFGSRMTLIVEEESPAYSLPFLARCMDLTPAELKSLLDE